MSAGWQQLAGEDGVVIGVAVDHRDSFRAALRASGIADADDELVAAIKVDVCAALGPEATMLLVDELALDGLRARGIDPAPFAMPLEAQGYGALLEVTRTVLVERPTPREVAGDGGAACKLLLPFRPDRAEHAATQLEVAELAVAACHVASLPLILEPIVWSAPGEAIDGDRLAELVVEAAHVLAPLEPGLLKLQYPGSREACDAVHAACGGHPWVLLGGGAPLAQLEQRVADACAAGAVGCIVGRSLFDGALDADAVRRGAWLRDVARPALQRLASSAAWM